jgi:uncharacterized SAM-binding protein YcdF (DUF218 family)
LAVLGALGVVYYYFVSRIVGFFNLATLAILAIATFFILKGTLFCFSEKVVAFFKSKKWITRTYLSLLTIVLAVFIIYEGIIIHAARSEPIDDADYIIVLGARVVGTNPGRPLWERIKTAHDYLEKNPNTIAILSGGQGSDELISEARCMFNELTRMGIDPSRLIMEDKSTSTFENMTFSLEHIKGEDVSVGIVTNGFHIYRSLRLFCQVSGYDGFAIAAHDGEFGFIPYYYIREFFAFLAAPFSNN